MSAHEVKDKRTFAVLVLIFVFLALGIILSGYFYYQTQAKRYRIQIEDQLTTIAKLKVDLISGWREERKGDAAVFYKNVVFSDLVQTFFKKSADVKAGDQLRAWLHQTQTAYQYERVFLFDAQGVERMSVPDTPKPEDPYLSQNINNILESGQVTFLDFHRDRQNESVRLAVIAPIFNISDSRRVIGIVVLQIDPWKYLYPFIQRWPTSDRTAETLLIRREGNEVVFLNELRFQKNTALNLRLSLEKKNYPAVMAVQGKKGIVEGIDYRKKQVIADVRAIPDSPWFLVAKMDEEEVYGPLRERLWIVIVFIVALLLSAGVGVGLIWRHQQTRFYRERYEATETLHLSQEEVRKLGDLVERSSQPVGIGFTDGRFGRFNPAFHDLVGYTNEELQAMNWSFDLTPPEWREVEREKLEELQRTGHPVRYEKEYIRKDGSGVPIELLVHIEKDKNGQIDYYYAFVSDITERKRAEEALRQSGHKNFIRNEIAQIFLTVPDESMYAEVLKIVLREMESKYGVFSYLDEHGDSIAPSMTRDIWEKCQIPDKTIVFPRETWGDSIWGRAILEKRSLWKNESGKVPQGHVPIENVLCVPILFRDEVIAHFEIANRQGGYGEAEKERLEEIARFIAPVLQARLDRKRAEEALLLSEEKLSKAFRASPDWMTINTLEEGRYIDVNDAFVQITGYGRDEVIGKTSTELKLWVYPEDRTSALEIMKKEGRLRNFESLFRMRSGETRIMRRSAEIIELMGEQCMVSVNRDITERRRAQEKVQETLEVLRRALGGVILVLSLTVERRDPCTAGHQKRVAHLARAIAEEMGLAEGQRDGLRMAGTIHDLGKVSIPAEILSKPTKLTENEHKLIQTHPQIGYNILKEIDFPWPLAEMIFQHHERLNGSGYPRGLKGEHICLEARILAVADVIEAMASHRPYRPALGINAALEEIEKNAGALYDKDVVEKCLRLFREKGFSFS